MCCVEEMLHQALACIEERPVPRGVTLLLLTVEHRVTGLLSVHGID